MPTIRPATLADAQGIARVHVDTWRTTYRGIVPDSYLDNLDYSRRAADWERILDTAEGGQFVFVTEDDSIGQIVGFAAGGPPRPPQPDYAGELYAIYVLQDQQGKGLGGALLRAVAGELRRQGVNSMLLWVLTDNPHARRFYEGLGGQFLRNQQFELGGVTLTEAGYGWPDLALLAI